MTRPPARAALAVALGLTVLLAGCGGKAPTADPAPAATSAGVASTGPAGTPDTTGTAAPTSGDPTTSAASPSGSPAATTPSAAPASPGIRSVVFTVRGRKVSPAPGRVRVAVGEQLQLVVVADVASELHLHSEPAVEARTTPGRPTVLTFTARRPGVYELELHHPSLLITRLVVQ